MNRHAGLEIGSLKIALDLDPLQTCDPLTKTWNRRLLDILSERICGDFKMLGKSDKMNVEESWLSIMLVDLMGFKQINDTYGHDVGDSALKLFASASSDVIRTSDLLIRLGGDEFLFIFPNVDEKTSQTIANRIIGTLKNSPLELQKEGTKIYLQGAFGITIFKMRYFLEEHSWEKFLKTADRLMYSAKYSTDGGFKSYVFDPDRIDEHMDATRSGADEMRRPQQALLNSIIDFLHAIDGYSKYYSGRCRYLGESFFKWMESRPAIMEFFERKYPFLSFALKSRMSRQALIDVIAWHDVGKTFIPKEILSKKSNLDAKEWLMIKQHVIQGANLLETILKQTYSDNDITHKSLETLVRGAMQHHENWEGSGYPEGLYENDISEIGRLVAIIGSYSSMMSSRPFAAEQPVSFVAREIFDGAGKRYDPDLTLLFLCYLCAEHPDEIPENVSKSAEETLSTILGQ